MSQARSESAVTAIVLCGGQATRLGGIDKCLEPIAGEAMVDRVLARLKDQVDAVVISANRNLTSYRARGFPVCTDTCHDLPGPLAGVASCLSACATPRVQLCPGDTPRLPLDLVSRLSAQLPAYPSDGNRPHYLHALVSRSDLEQLANAETAPRSVGAWLKSLGASTVDFSDQADTFLNVNAPADLTAARQPSP